MVQRIPHSNKTARISPHRINSVAPSPTRSVPDEHPAILTMLLEQSGPQSRGKLPGGQSDRPAHESTGTKMAQQTNGTAVNKKKTVFEQEVKDHRESGV